MPSQTTKVKNGSIALPPEIRKNWKDAEVFVYSSRDSILIKKLERPTLATLRPKLKAAGKEISARDINEAVRAVRRRSE